jgi:hypothetical protein
MLSYITLEEVRPGAAVGDDESLHRYIYATADSLFHGPPSGRQ